MPHSVFTSVKHKLVIYELFVRLFSNCKTSNIKFGTLKENGVGKFDDITITALEELKKLGITHCWYMGVLEHACLTDYSKFGILSDDPRVVKGRAGSPYAIKDYYDVSPDLANDVENRIAEFENLISRTHEVGLKAIIDFVPNHVARTYRSDKRPDGINDFGQDDKVDEFFHPENNYLYILKSTFDAPSDYSPLEGVKVPKKYLKLNESPAKVTGNDIYKAQPSMNDWFETVKLNFGVDPHSPHPCLFDPIPDTWKKLLDIILYWCNKGIDGFRCDMAEMVPAEFWEWLIPCVKIKYPEIIFIAEIYKTELYKRYLDKGCFDYLYDKVRLYDVLIGILKGNKNADELSVTIRANENFSERMLSFLENHDEERLMGNGICASYNAIKPAMLVTAAVSCGPVMLYNGQEVGERAIENVGFAGNRNRTSIFDYASMPEHLKWINKKKFDGGKLTEQQKAYREFYSTLLNFCINSDAIVNGKFYDLQYINRFNQSEGFDERHVYAFLRHTENERLLIIGNFSVDTNFDIYVKIPVEALKLMAIENKKEFVFEEMLENEIKITVNNLFLSNVKSKTGGVAFKLKPSAAYIFQIL